MQEFGARLYQNAGPNPNANPNAGANTGSTSGNDGDTVDAEFSDKN